MPEPETSGKPRRRKARGTQPRGRRRRRSASLEAALARAEQDERRPRALLLLGSLGALLGLAMVGVGPTDIGTAVVVASVCVLAYGVHGFGRLGPTEIESGEA